MTYLMWSAAASAVVISLEAFFRSGLDWRANMWWLIPAAVLSNYLIYRLVVSAPTYILAFPAFSLTNLALRTGLSHFLLDEPIKKGNLVAVLALVAAIVIGHVWR